MRYSVVSATDAAKLTEDRVGPDILALFTARKSHSVHDSLLGRLLVAELARIPPERLDRFLAESLDDHHDRESGCFWSTSHKEGWIAAAVDDRPVGIDIETLRPRDPALFAVFSEAEWRLLGRKDWPDFYRGWTAKEAAIKVMSLGLERLSEIRVAAKDGDAMILAHGERRTTVEIFHQKDVIIAVARTEA